MRRTQNAHRLSIQNPVDLLSTFGGRGPGIDKTGLQGVYDFTLMWDDDAGRREGQDNTMPYSRNRTIG